ncbi:MAG: ABC transporter permease [Proteocatella sp.]
MEKIKAKEKLETKEKLKPKKIRINIKKLSAVLFWVSLWQLMHIYIGKSILLPSPSNVFSRIFTMIFEANFWSAVSGSIGRITVGFILACLFGVLISAFSYRFKIIKLLVEPFIMTIKAVPVASFVILALVWIKSSNLSTFISFIMVLPIIYTNVTKGLENMDQDILEMTELFKIGSLKKIIYIYIPMIMPFFLSGVSIGIGFCWKSGIAAEVIGLPKNSIGENLYNAKIFLDTTELFAWTFTIIIISVIYEKIIVYLIEKLCKKIEIK